jgi:hypothetical protein
LLAKDSDLSSSAVYKLLRDTSAHLPTASGVTDSVDACAAVVSVVGHGSCSPHVSSDDRLAGTETN